MEMHLELTDAALAEIAKAGFDPVYGARPLKRAVQKLVLDPLSKKVLGGEFVAGDTIAVDVHDGALAFGKVVMSREPQAAERKPRARA